MTGSIDVQFAVDNTQLPSTEQCNQWVQAALGDIQGHAEIVVRFVTEEESAELNTRYREKSSATNVLSFTYDVPQGVDWVLMGDIVVCAAVVEREAMAQGKSIESHYAHMIVHGVLHLRGLDHQSDAEAEHMEQQEIDILSQLGFASPY